MFLFCAAFHMAAGGGGGGGVGGGVIHLVPSCFCGFALVSIFLVFLSSLCSFRG